METSQNQVEYSGSANIQPEMQATELTTAATSQEVSIEADDQGDQYVREAVQPARKTMQEIMEALKSQPQTSTTPSVLPIEKSTGGKMRFRPNTDPNRSVLIAMPIDGEQKLHLRTPSSKEGDGGFINKDLFDNKFDRDIFEHPHGTQVTLVVANELLYGYLVRGKSRLGIAFTKQYLPASITLPELGYVLPIVVKMVIIG
jgi:hypothetical protein